MGLPPVAVTGSWHPIRVRRLTNCRWDGVLLAVCRYCVRVGYIPIDECCTHARTHRSVCIEARKMEGGAMDRATANEHVHQINGGGCNG